MNNLHKTTTRLRRTFAYPSSSSSSSSSDSDSDLDNNRKRASRSAAAAAAAALDEQEQEDLIRSLAQQNASRNAQFRLLLLVLPAVSALPYVAALARGAAGRFESVLALSSLAATAWLLWALPPGRTGVGVLDAWVAGSESGRGKGSGSGKGYSGQKGLDRNTGAAGTSPLAMYLPYLNVVLCAVLVFAGVVSKAGGSQREEERWGHVGLSNLPAIVYGVVLVANMVMGGVDPERDLGALRYEYKGA